MKALFVGFIWIVLVLAGTLLTKEAPKASFDPTILRMTTMKGSPGLGRNGETENVRGFQSSVLRWKVGQVKGALTSDGKLDLLVTGLVTETDHPGVSTGKTGNENFEPLLKVVISCETITENGSVEKINLSPPATYPASLGRSTQGGGVARIQAQVELPSPCMSPQVLITNQQGEWLAKSYQ